jgi:hypothetical protein
MQAYGYIAATNYCTIQVSGDRRSKLACNKTHLWDSKTKFSNSQQGLIMKSAWELALERSGGNLNELSDDKKANIAEIENKYKAKLAEIEITYQHKFDAATKVEELEQLKDNMAVEQASARSKAENNKKDVRNS